jgi:hypothetical protein
MLTAAARTVLMTSVLSATVAINVAQTARCPQANVARSAIKQTQVAQTCLRLTRLKKFRKCNRRNNFT